MLNRKWTFVVWEIVKLHIIIHENELEIRHFYHIREKRELND